MLIVADSSALIATCDGLDVLLQVYDDIKVPEAVYAEIVAPEKPQSDALGSFLSGRIVKVDTSHWVLAAGGLGRGEIEDRSNGSLQATLCRCVVDRRSPRPDDCRT